MGMEDTVQPITTGSYRGLNTKLSEISISSREASSLYNVNLTKETAECRNGTILFSTTQLVEGGAAKAVTGIYQAILGGTTFQVVTGGTKIYSMTGAGVLADITGAVTITNSANNLFSFAQFLNSAAADIIIAANGVDATIKWTGAGNVAALAGTPGNFKYLLVRKNRLWATIGDILYNSELRNAESWDTTNWIARFSSPGFTTNDITGLAKFGDNVFVGKEKQIVLVSGENLASSSGYIQEIVTGDGPAGGYGIYEVFSRRYGQIIAFWNKNLELKGFNGTKDLIHLSDPIDSTRTLKGFNSGRSKYASGTIYGKMNQYLATVTSTPAGTSHDRLIGYDYSLDGYPSAGEDPESTCLIHGGFTANVLATVTITGNETLLMGTYDGWVLQGDIGATDIVQASEIAASPGGADRAANVVTITTKAPHGLVVGDTVTVAVTTIATGAGSFNGTFVIATVPSTTTFTYAQTEVDATGGAGIVKKTAKISAHWQSKKHDFGSAAHQKQINDFSLVTNCLSQGQMQVTAQTEGLTGTKAVDIAPGGSVFGGTQFGNGIFGGGGISYSPVVFDVGSGDDSLAGRYFRFKFENVNGFQFVLEEYIAGATDLGYQTATETA